MSIFYTFTDGSSLGNTPDSPAGSAAYFPVLHRAITYGTIGTSNYVEIFAIRMALWYIKNVLLNDEFTRKFSKIVIYSDSEYAIGVVDGKNKAKQHQELVNVCKAYAIAIRKEIVMEILHVKAHTGKKDFIFKGNDIADKEAKNAAEKKKKSMEMH